jgi:PqqD family protein of HPr-rel-A system
VIDPPYELAPAVRVVLLDDEAVVFNPFSWETHVLNAAAALVLERIVAGPCHASEVEALLAEALDPSERAQAASHAERLLHDLGSLRLIKRCPGPAHAGL